MSWSNAPQARTAIGSLAVLVITLAYHVNLKPLPDLSLSSKVHEFYRFTPVPSDIQRSCLSRQ